MGICQGSLPKTTKPLKRELKEKKATCLKLCTFTRKFFTSLLRFGTRILVHLHDKLQAPIIIFMVGGPGCGKGVQCARLADKYNFYHVAIGDLLREEASRATSKGKVIKDIMLKGALVPTGYILDLLTDNMLKSERVKGYFIEGFPREINQARMFEEVVGRPPNIVIVFDCSTETMIQRLLIRSQMGERVDDHERIIRQRLETHYTLCEPVFTYYLQKSLLRNILAEEPPEVVFCKCCSVIDDVLKAAASQASTNNPT
ncbi:adenylate kinase isoenzyme 1-like isoform X3 [Hemicordylus capensis]|uniref:adenylate kinase isoenzyme 1-like isoform X3 n=1 Tax=Hemicordylus capensis TaxID=884348 RepID=UPI002304BA2D|nr:adenylate kinase isoenzyme 1-like isoform X3 [Hemicordylus capensis]